MKRLFVWLNQIIKKHKEINRWKRIVTALAAMITFVTTYALILPAITVERNNTEEVGGMYLKQEEDRNELFEENALELNGVSIAADQENAVTYEYSDEDMTAVPTFGTDEEAMAAAAETDAEIPDYSDSQEKSAPADSAETDGEEAAPEVGTLKAAGSDYTVTLTYDTTSEIPDGASLTVYEIAQDSKEYKTYLEETKKAMGLTEEETLPRFDARIFDIKITTDRDTALEHPIVVESTIDQNGRRGYVFYNSTKEYCLIYGSVNNSNVFYLNTANPQNPVCCMELRNPSDTSNPGLISTADTKAEGIKINLFDYGTDVLDEESNAWTHRTSGLNQYD